MPLLGGTTGLFRAAGGLLAGCVEGCCGGLYTQARRCDTGAIANLWKVGAFTSASRYFFTKTAVCYRLDETCPTSTTPGTLLAGEIVISGCLACASCCERGNPTGSTIVGSGIAVSAVCCNGYKMSAGTISFTFDVASGCNPSVSQLVTGPSVEIWDNLDCTGTVQSTETGWFVSVLWSISTGARSAQIQLLTPGLDPNAPVVFENITTIIGCPDSTTLNNTLSSTCRLAPTIDNFPTNGSGTIIITPRWN